MKEYKLRTNLNVYRRRLKVLVRAIRKYRSMNMGANLLWLFLPLMTGAIYHRVLLVVSVVCVFF